MALIDVQDERETDKGWSYRVVVTRPSGETSEHEVSLSWADHDYWSGGSVPPSRVVEALLRVLVEQPPEGGLPASFDAARARRWNHEIDDEVMRRV